MYHYCNMLHVIMLHCYNIPLLLHVIMSHCYNVTSLLHDNITRIYINKHNNIFSSMYKLQDKGYVLQCILQAWIS